MLARTHIFTIYFSFQYPFFISTFLCRDSKIGAKFELTKTNPCVFNPFQKEDMDLLSEGYIWDPFKLFICPHVTNHNGCQMLCGVAEV